MINLISLAIFHKIDILLKGKTPQFILHAGKNVNEYYIISYILLYYLKTFLIATRGENFPSKMNYPILFSFVILIASTILIEINNRYIHFTITTLKNPVRNFVFALIWITNIIAVIYIYPKVEVYATIWNNYLKDENTNSNSPE